MTLIIPPNNKIPILDHIINNLYLGDIEAAKQISNLEDNSNINTIVNVTNTRYPSNQKIIYHHIDIDDSRKENISQYFDQFNKIVDNAQFHNKNVLVHCANSVSRSPTLVLAYLIHKGLTLKEALNLLKKRDQYTHPNIGFCRQLLDYEKYILGKNSILLSELYQ